MSVVGKVDRTVRLLHIARSRKGLMQGGRESQSPFGGIRSSSLRLVARVTDVRETVI